MQPGEGERLHAAKRKRFWFILGGLALLGGITGFFGGLLLHTGEVLPLPGWASHAAILGVGIMALAVAYGSWRFFATVDELELADNLWGSLIGFYWYAILFPSWWALNKLGAVPPPDHWAIFASAMLAACAVYFFRKWRNR